MGIYCYCLADLLLHYLRRARWKKHLVAVRWRLFTTILFDINGYMYSENVLGSCIDQLLLRALSSSTEGAVNTLPFNFPYPSIENPSKVVLFHDFTV